MPRTTESMLDARADAPFEIKLRAPGTSGYEWKADFDHVAFSLVSQRRVANVRRMGASALDVFLFRPLSQGQHEILFRLLRPWEDEPVEQAKYAVHIR